VNRAGRRRTTALAFLIGLLLVTWPTGPGASGATNAPKSAGRSNPFRIGRTLVIPHAGGDGLFPENTLYAYERSIELGGDVIDIDIQLTKDGVPVAFHDPTLDRTTDGRGQVRDRTVAEIQRLDAGYRFARNGRFPFRGRGFTVPTLEELLRRFPNTPTTLDLKDQRVDVVKPVCRLLRELRRTHDVYVGIDVSSQVLAFREQCGEVRTSGTSEERRRARAARERGESGCTGQLVSQPRYIGQDGTPRVTAESLQRSHRCNTAVLTWVIDDPATMRRLIALGVDGIYTRRPDLLAAELRRT
jgi:glycerophosphoryl diester phosphodiesterase